LLAPQVSDAGTDRWRTITALVQLVDSGTKPHRPANRLASLTHSLGAAFLAARRESVAFSAENRDLVGPILIYERPRAHDVLRAMLRRRFVFVVPGTTKDIFAVVGVDSDNNPLYLRLGANGLAIFVGRRARRAVVSRVAFSPRARIALTKLEACARVATAAVGTLAPEIVDVTDMRIIETRLPGRTRPLSTLKENALQEAILSALDPLVLLARQSSTHNPDTELIQSIRQFVARHTRSSDLKSALTLVTDWDRSRLIAGIVHGDYWLENILFDDANRITGIVDWDMARTDGCIVLDALHLGLMTYSMWADVYVSENLSSIWTGNWKFPWLARYCNIIVPQKFGIASGDLKRAMALLWLWYLYSKNNPSPDWEQRMIGPMLPAFRTANL
jgi:Phosphotransferase enzyme family